MKKRTLATISKHGSINWKISWQEIDVETMVKIQMFAESIAKYQSVNSFGRV